MSPDRAAEIASLVCLAAARRTSERDTFEILRASKVSLAELTEVAELVPQIGQMPSFVNGSGALSTFERTGIEPGLSFSLGFAEELSRAAATAARRRARQEGERA